MCDCFHLAFPNWHAPAAGAGRRLRGPEQEAEDDSVCEDPEVLERERPRPQGSSPIEEFPVEKQAEEDISDPVHKCGSNKKSRKAGFGSLFEKRTSDRMNETEDVQSGESEVIVKTVKEACVEGLVVTGGGKEGIFIKEVKLDSPASRELRVKEGDQILSATVYFDNVSYEDALQILEHAQSYKMEFLLRRKVEPSIPENAELMHPEEKDHGPPVMRSQRKMKKQQERISWPKFPSFGKGPRVQFNRSHSTSEAEEHRKLELSPPTSDNESPIKTPLKCPDGKDKKKKHKVELKMKMKGHRSKSVEEGILEEKVAKGHEEKNEDILQVLDRAEYEISTKTENDDPFEMERHEAHLISLGNTLKTTDISVALAEGGKIKSSEIKVRVHEEGTPDIGAENQAESFKGLHTISAPPAHDSDVLPQAVVETFDNDLNIQATGKDSSEKKVEFGHAELGMPNLDICVGPSKKSPRIGDEKQRRSGFQNESYGIRTRGPMADIATAKSHFVRTENGLQFISPDFSELMQVGKTKDKLTDKEEIETSTLPTERLILTDLDRTSTTKFKLPKIENSVFVPDEEIKITEVEKIRTHLPKRDDIEIPGMEKKEIKPSLQTPEIKLIKTEKIINIPKESEIQYHQIDEEFNVEDVKVAVSKFPCFKLPEGDITGVLVQREITIMEQKSEKSTPRGSPRKISTTSTDSFTSILKSKVGEEKSPSIDTVDKDTAFKVPKVELPSIDEQTSTPVMKIDYTQLQITDYERFGDINFKLPKREDIEIPGMEAIKESKLQDTGIKTVSGADLDKAERPRTKKHSDKKGHDKESKKTIQPENQSPNISTELQKRDPSKINTEETRIHENQTFKMPQIGDVKNIDAPVQEIKLLEDTMHKKDLPQKTEPGKTKYKIPSIILPEFGTDVKVEEAEIILPEDKLKLSHKPLLSDLEGIDVNKDGQSVNVYGRAYDTEAMQGTKFKLPKFEISFPEVKAPRIICTSKKDDDSSLSERESAEVPVVHASKAELPDVKLDVSTDQTEINSEITKVKIKRPGFSFPRFGIATSEHTAQEADVNLTNVDMSLPEGSIEMQSPAAKIAISVKEGKQKDATKFKIPSIKFPHFGAKVTKTVVETSYVEPDVKGAQISLPHTEVKSPSEPIIIKDSDGDKEKKSEFIFMDIEGETQRRKFKPPKFPEVKEPKIDASSDIDISKEKLKMNPPDIEVQAGTHEVKVDLPFGMNILKTAREILEVDVDVKGPDIVLPDAKIKLSAEPLSVDLKGPDADKEINSLSMDVKVQDIQIKEKASKFKLPTSGISIPEIKGPKINLSSDKKEIDIYVPKAQVDVHSPGVEVQGVKAELKTTLPEVCSKDFETKRKTPSFSFPNADFSKSDVEAPEISLPEAEIKLSAEPLSVDVKGPDADKQTKFVDMEIKDLDFQMKEQGTKFKLPKFGVSLPEIKGPKIDASSDKAAIDISVPKGKVEVHPHDVEVQGVTAEVETDLPEVDSKDFEVKMKTPGFSFPKIGFDKSEVKAPEVDVSLPEGNLEIEKPTTDVTVSIEDAELKGQSKFGSPTTFKLPSINFPKFGIKGPKASVEIPDVDVEVKGPVISLPEAEIKLSTEPLSVDVKGPDADKQSKSVSMEIKDQDIQMKEQGTKVKMAKFGISLPEIKGPKIDVSSDTAAMDISVPKGKVEVHPPDVEVQGVTAELKADLPEVDSKDFDVKIKTPGFSFPKIGFDKSEVKAPEVDVSLPEGNLEIEKPTTDVTVSIEDAELKGQSKFGSPTTFKLPSINFPKFGIKGPKASVEIPDVDVEVKGREINLPEAEIKLSAEPLSVDVKGPDADKQSKSVSVEIKDQDIQMKEEGTKFKLPKFGISLPEIKGPKIDVSSEKAAMDISVPKGKVEVHPPDVEVQGVTAELKADLPEVDSKDFDVKMKTPGFSFPKIGFDKSEVKAPEVDVSLPEGNLEIEKPTTDVTVSIEDAELKGRSKFGSPTKYKLPSINFPKFGIKGPKASVEIPDVDVEVKGPVISLPEAEIKLSAEPLSVDVKGPDADKQSKSVSVEIKDQDIQMKEQGTKFKLPKFGISLPEIKGPKIDVSSEKAAMDISVPKGKVEVHPPDVEVQGVTAELKADLPEVDSKDFDVKMKTPGFSFPKIGFDKSEVKAPEVDVSLPEGNFEIEKPTTDVTVSIENADLKGQSKFGSPTTFKLPSINFPKFGIKGPKASVEIPDVDVEVKGPVISLPEAEIKLSAEPLSVDVKGPDADKQSKSVSVEIKDQDIQMKEQGTKFKLPKFGISLPEIKGPKMGVSSDKAAMDISLPKGKVEVHPSDVEVQCVTAEVKADLPEVDSKDSEVKMKTPGFSFPKIGFDKSEVKAPEVDVSLPEGNLEIEKPTTDVTVSIEDAELKGRSKFGSPTKYKLPSINFPKFGIKGPKASVEIPDVDVEVKGPVISLPEAEIKLSAEPLSVDVKGPDADKQSKSVSVEIKDQDFQMKEQGSKFKLPKFGISLPEIKGPRIGVSSDKAAMDISLPKGKVEVHPPDVEVQCVTAEVKADLPEVDSKDFEVKMKTPGFSFPKIGFDKSEVKAPEVDVSLPEGNLEIEKPTTDVTVSIEDAELKGRSKFGSPTKYKLPSINFPKFGIKGPKASVEIPDVDVEVKGPVISLPEAEIKLSAEPLSVDVKGPDADKQSKSVSVEIKDQDFQMKEQGSKFKLPKFGISLPEIKGPKIGVSSDKAAMDISLPKGKVEVHPPDVEVQCVTAEVKADLPEVDSKDFEVKMKTPGFSFPKIGFDKSEVKAPEVDVSLPEGNLEIEKPTTDVTVSIEDAELKGRSKFGSPTKYKLPSINFPKFGIKGPKASVEIPDVDVEVKGPVISLPEAEIKLSAEPLSVDVKGPDANKQSKSVSVEIKDQDIQMKEQGSKFKLPKFGISLPEIKGPKIGVSSDKAAMDISLPKGKVEVHPPDVEVQCVTAEVKADLPEVDSKDFEVKIKTPGLSFPKIGFDKSEVKAPEVDVSLPEGNLEIEKPTTDVTVSIEDAELKGRSKFGSPTKYKLPSINFPKFGIKGPKASVEIPDVDVEVKGRVISLPEAEIKLSAEPLSVDVKRPDADKQSESVSVEIKDQDIQMKEQGSKFKLPKFGISLPEIKGPKIGVSSDKAAMDISLPKGKVEVHPPDVEVQCVTAEVKADLPEVDSKDFEVKMKTPGFSFPKIGFDKSEVKAPEVDVSLPEGNLEIEKPTTDVTVSIEDAELKGRSKFGSPTKYKLPSINFPKFGIKGPKASVEIPDVDVEVKGPVISLPEAEIKLSAEPLSVDVKGPDADKQSKSVSVEIKDEDIQMKEQGSKFKLPKFGISLPEIKGPKIDVSSDKAAMDISLPKGKVEVHPPDVEVQCVTAEVKADMPEVDSKDFEVKMKTPGFSFPKIGFDESEVKAPEVDVSLPEGNLEIEKPTTDVTVSIEDAELKGRSKFGSPTKYKLPSINFPKFGIKGPKASVEIPDVDVEVKGPVISLPEAEIKLSAEALSVDVKGPDADKQSKSVSVEIKDQDIQMKEQGSKFKLPKFGISLPEIKGPKIGLSSDKAATDISLPKGKVEVHPPDVEVQGVTAEVKADLPEVDSKDFEVKMKTPGFSFPKIGFDKSEVKAPEVDVSLPEGNFEIEKPTTDVTVSIEDAELKGRSKFGSPTKFKFPSINFPKFGIKGPKASVEIPDVDVEVKGPEISLPEAEIKLSAEPLSGDVKGPDADKQSKSVSLEIKDQDIQTNEQGTKFKLPKFGISLPEIKGPKIDVSSDKAAMDISVPKGKVEVHPPDVEVQCVTAEVKADQPEVDSKDFEVKMKTPGFSFPKIGFDKSEVKAPEVDVSLPEGNLEFEKPTTDVTVSIEDAELKGRSKFGSPTKYKLPSINFPKFGIKGPKASVEIPDVDVEVKGPVISLPEAEIKLSAEPLSVDVKGPDADKQSKSVSVEIKDQDIQMKEQGSKFKLPKFGISLPEIKGPKIGVSSDTAAMDISLPKGKVEVHPPDVEVQGVTAEVKADLSEVDSKDFEVKMKTPGFSFPKIGFDKSEVKAPEVDVSLPKGNLEIEKPTTDVTVSIEDAELKGRSKFGSPTKFKLPSINFPKFGIKGPKASVEIPDVDVEVKGPEISLPEAEIKLSAEPLSVDVKGPDADKQSKSVSVEIKDQDIQMKEQGSKFKLPKFGISLPEIKGPKIGVSSDTAAMDISLPKGKVEVHPPDVEVQGVTAEVKADLPEVDSKDFEVKMKTPGFSFPKIGFDKSEVKAPEVDVSLPKGNLEIEKPTTDVTVSIEDAELKGRSKFGSPTKFKLPSINFPKFGIKGPKASVEIPDVDVEVKGPEISLPEAEIKLSAEPLSVDVKGPDADKQSKSVSVEIKDQDIQTKEQGTKFKLPKFGISLPEIKGPKIDVSSDKAAMDISVPKGKVEVHPPDVEVQCVTAEVKADQPEVDSKDFEVKMKTPGFSFPKIGFDKSEVKAPEVDVSLPEGNVEFEKPTTDVTVSIEDAELKGRSKFGSPTKYKLPSINFPKFGIKGPKASVEIPDVDVEVKGPVISLPEAEIKLSAEPLSVDVKGPHADKQSKSVSVEIKDQDIQMKEQGSKFKLPKFGISLPEIKGPKIGVSSDTAAMDISLPKGKVEVHPPDVEVQCVTAEVKADQPEVDSKDFEVKMKTPGFSFPKIGFDKSEVKAPEVDVSLPKGNLEIEKPTTDVTVSIEDAELKGRSKFGSPTKFKLPSINFPKFGIKGPKASVEIPDVDVEVKGPEISLPEAEIKLSAEPLSVDVKGPDADKQSKSVSVEIKDQDIQTKEQGTKFKLPKFGISLPEIKGPKIDVSSDKALEIDISVPQGKVEAYPSDVDVQDVTAKINADLPEVDPKDCDIKMKRPGLSKFGKSDSKVLASDPSLQVVDISTPEKSKIEGPTTEITKDDHFGMAHPKVKDPEINIVSKSTSKPESGISLTKEVKIQSVNVKVKNNEEPIPQMNSLMGTYIAENDKACVDILESKQKYTQRVKTSSKFILPTLGDVFSGFEVEFNVPTFDEIEGANKIYSNVPLTKEECNISVKGQFLAESVSKHEDEGAQENSKTDQNNLGGQKQTQPEISDWFRFPAFSSPTKTAKDNERITFQLLRKAEPSPENNMNENECKRSFTREFDEDNISPTLSLSSSDAFADISSALTTEQISLSLPSPTKVKVKYSEPIANAEGSDIHIVTSTARTELISIEPHQPEKVNIPFSSETSSSSVDTLKQISGHIVVANVQSVSKTEHATIITKVDTQDLNTLPAENVTDSMLSAEETTIQTEHRTIYQKHSIKEVR